METGPTGPTGIELSGAKAYDPAIASTYSVGQVVTYEGGTYIVDSAPPLGTPDTSPDYTLLAAPVLQVQQVAQVLLDLLVKRESPVLLGLLDYQGYWNHRIGVVPAKLTPPAIRKYQGNNKLLKLNTSNTHTPVLFYE